MSYLIHECPREDFEPVHVPAGHPCPNGCGWIAADGNLEAFAVKEAAAALALYGPWLRLSEAAEQSGIGFSTIAQAARTGRLPFLKIGRQKFVRLSAALAACSKARGRRRN